MDKQDNPVLRNLIKAIIRLSRSTDCGEINNLYVISCDLLADLVTCSLCDAAKVIAERSKKGGDKDAEENQCGRH